MGNKGYSLWFYAYMLLILILFLGSGGYIIQHLYKNEVNPCTANPLVYAANKWERDYGHPLTGSGDFKDKDGEDFIVEFNTSGILIRDPHATYRVATSNFVDLNLTKAYELVNSTKLKK
jgi:hypothetical protein